MSRNGKTSRGAPPFSLYERLISGRLLFATRKDGGVALMSIIAFVGVALAVAALIAVMSIMNGFRYELVSRLLGVDGHVYVQAPNMSLEEAAKLQGRLTELGPVETVYPMVAGQALASTQGAVAPVVIRGVTPQDMAETPFLVEKLNNGGSPEFGEGRNGGEVVYTGKRLAEQLGLSIGDAITIISPQGAQTPFGTSVRRKSYLIGDYIEIGLTELDGVLVYMPLDQAQLFLGKGDQVDQVEVRLNNPDEIDAGVQAVRAALSPGYFVFDWRDRNRSLFNALQVERMAMRLILMLVVLIAALNIISGFTMMVRNKAGDIAILRTVGAPRAAIMRVFLMSGASLGALGTLTGLILGVLFCEFIGPIQGFLEFIFQTNLFDAEVYGLDHLPARIDYAEVGFVAFWGFLVSVVVTLIPAWFAARVDPVEALRYE